MPIELKMPALSPTMEEGTLAKWLVKEGDEVKSGDILAEIETDKATMEFEAVDEGKIARILVPEGSEGVKVGAPIAILAGEGEDASAAASAALAPPPSAGEGQPSAAGQGEGAAPKADKAVGTTPPQAPVETPPAPSTPGDDPLTCSALAARGAGEGQGLAAREAACPGPEHRPSAIQGSGPGGRIVRADVDAAAGKAPAAAPAGAPRRRARARHPPRHAGRDRAGDPARGGQALQHPQDHRPPPDRGEAAGPAHLSDGRHPARRVAQASGELNKGLESRGVKLSVNDLMIKALAQSLIEVPECNVAFAGDHMLKYSRADISVAVSIPAGLITPIIVGAEAKSVSAISTEMKELAGLAKDGKLQPQQYQGGTASLSNMGMFGIKQFEAVINPPQGMIMAIGAGEKRPYVINDSLADRDRHERHRKLRPPRHRRRRRRQADAGVQAAGRKPAGDAGLSREAVIRVTAMPADTNPYGGVFGGWLMGQMGLACGSFASRRTARQGDPGRGGRDQVPRRDGGRRRAQRLCRAAEARPHVVAPESRSDRPPARQGQGKRRSRGRIHLRRAR